MPVVFRLFCLAVLFALPSLAGAAAPPIELSEMSRLHQTVKQLDRRISRIEEKLDRLQLLLQALCGQRQASPSDATETPRALASAEGPIRPASDSDFSKADCELPYLLRFDPNIGFLHLPFVVRFLHGRRSGVPCYWFPDRKFELPFSTSFDGRIKKMLLYASRDGDPYERVAVVAPSAGHFVYRAPADGQYFFIVQFETASGRRYPCDVSAVRPPDCWVLVDANGRRYPPDMNAVWPPDSWVIVDTLAPKVSLKPVQAAGVKVAVEWQVSDDNLAIGTLHLEYRAVGDAEPWTPLPLVPMLDRAGLSWEPPSAGTYEVRLTVQDLAENSTSRTTRVEVAAGQLRGR